MMFPNSSSFELSILPEICTQIYVKKYCSLKAWGVR